MSFSSRFDCKYHYRLIVRIADLPLFYSAVLGIILYFSVSFFLGIITVGMIRIYAAE